MEYTSDLYWKTLSIARELYRKLYGDPQSHDEWAKSFNITGDICVFLIKNNEKES